MLDVLPGMQRSCVPNFFLCLSAKCLYVCLHWYVSGVILLFCEIQSCVWYLEEKVDEVQTAWVCALGQNKSSSHRCPEPWCDELSRCRQVDGGCLDAKRLNNSGKHRARLTDSGLVLSHCQAHRSLFQLGWMSGQFTECLYWCYTLSFVL